MERVLVVDVEATCWKGRQPPRGEWAEIIEIGLSEFDLTCREAQPPHSLLIKPQRSKVSPFCTHLTSITPEMVAEGMIFNQACTILRRDFDTQTPVWCSWGKFDRRIFQQQCHAFKVTFPFSQHHVNLKKLFAVLQHGQQAGRARQVGLMKAMQTVDLDFEGIPHRAGVDAYNTARLLGVMIERYGKAILNA